MQIEYVQIIKPRISDMNYGGHLGHMEMIGLLHEVRVQFLKKQGLSEIVMNEYVLVMRQLHLDYLNQAFWDNDLKVHMQLSAKGAKIIFNYSIDNLTCQNHTLTAEAAMVLINKNTQKPLKPNLFFEKLNLKNNLVLNE